MGLGELFALGAAIVWALAVIMFTKIGNVIPPFQLNLIKNTLGCILVSLTAFLFEGLNSPLMPISDWALMVISGVLGIAVADTLYMKALNTIGASNTGVIGALYSPFVVLISMVYLNETLTLLQFIGLIFVLTGVVVISLDKKGRTLQGKTALKGVMYGIVSVFFTALCVVVIKPILEAQPFFWSTAIRLFAGVVGMALYLWWRGRWRTTIQNLKGPQPWPQIIVSSVLAAYIAMMLFLAGYKYADASIAAILNETTAIFIVFLAWLVLKEEISWKKMLGITSAAIGVLLVVLD